MLTIKGNDFLLNGKKFNIYSGAIHYFRVLPEYWEDRLSKLKAAGFNTVETYVCWNLHEQKPGEFDFSGILDIVSFIKTAEKVGLYAIVRPGPYICAEWDFGGLPAWLLADPDMHVRCMYPPYLDAVKRFYSALLPLINPLQITNGGNVIAMQVENEYGSYGTDKAYLGYIEKLMLELGTDVLLFTSDGPNADMLASGTLPHIFKTANFGSASGIQLGRLRKFMPEGPLMCMEYWLGWFDHWGTRHHTRPEKVTTPDIKSMLKNDRNFNMYMFHGGTNFGFMSGANCHKEYTPTVTSYDYDAPLTEYGGYTKKYYAFRKALLEHQNLPETTLPPEPKFQSIGTVRLTEETSLLENLAALGEKHESVYAKPMEYFGQNFGLILYETAAPGNYPGAFISVDGLADRAYVYLNGKYKGVLWRNTGGNVPVGDVKEGDKIAVLIEGMGRINYGPKLHDRKGAERILICNKILSHFAVTTLPLDNIANADYQKSAPTYPKFLRGTFKTSSKNDCFVQTDGFTKGFVWINGFNLGRYWKIGPQSALYLPGPLLKEENEIVILELEGGKNTIDITDKPGLKKKCRFGKR